MKKIIAITSFICFLVVSSFAQDTRNGIKFGIGSSYFRPANFLGNNTMYIEYEHSLFKPVRIAANGFRLDAERVENDGNEQSMKGYQADLGLNIALFSNENNALKIGGGGTWQQVTNRFTTSIERDSNDQIINKEFSENDIEGYGWMANLEYEVYVIEHIVLGSKFTYKRYESGEEHYFFGLNAGFRF